MSKGQKRSNKETKKPKQEKAPSSAQLSAASNVMQTFADAASLKLKRKH